MSSSGGLVGGLVGATIGFLVSGGNPMGAVYGWFIGATAGSLLFPEQIQGPRLEDLKAQRSEYGWPIPVVYGTMRVAGNVIWQPPLVEVATEQDSKGGPEQTVFTYYAHAAVLLCRGPVAGVRRVWANKTLVYDAREGAVLSPLVGAIRIYLGDEAQTADALIVAHQGDSPAYRGWCYVVFESVNLSEKFGNRLPMFEFEVVEVGDEDLPDAEEIGDDSGGDSAIVTAEGELWTAYGADAGGGLQKCVVQISNPAALTELAQVEQVESGGGLFGGGIGAGHLMEIGNEIWVWNSALVPDSIMRFSKITRAYISSHLPDWGFNHIGAGHFDPLTGHVFAYGINVGPVVKIVNPATVQVTSGFVAPGSSVQACADIESVTSAFGGGIAILAGDVDTGGGLHLYPPAIDYTTVTPDFTYGQAQGFPTGGYTNQGSRLAYDAARGNLVIFGNVATNRKLVVINLLASTLTVVDWEATFGTRYSVTRNGVYHAGRDKFYAAGLDTSAPDAPSGGPSSRQVIEIDPVTFLPVRTIVHADEIIVGVCDDLLVPKDSNQFLIWMNISLSGATPVYKFPLDAPLAPQDVSLGDIVRDICSQADMVPASDVEAAALDATLVTGYAIPRQMSARAAIEALQGTFFFDAVESDDKLKFVHRGGAIAATIPEADRAAHAPGEEPPASLEITRLQETESPANLEVRYFDAARDYEISSAYARRLVRASRQQATLDLPVVLGAAKASQVAQANLYLSWQRARLSWRTGRKWAKLEPTDVVALPTAAGTYNVRIAERREHPSGLIEWAGATEDGAIYSQTGVASAVSNYPGQTIEVPGPAVMHLMDMPILRDDDNDAGFYAAYGTSGDAAGCSLYRSSDGSAYSLLKQFGPEAAIGVANGALAAGTKGNVFDYSQTLTVTMIEGELASDTQLNVLNGANLALLGDEVIQFKTATLTGGQTYQLTGLLRGRFGTERNMGAHVPGERFVVVDDLTWRRIADPTSLLNLLRFYKAPLFGASLSQAAAQQFTNAGAGITPYAGCQLRGSRDGSSNLTITWKRRTRIGGAWRDLVDVPLGETSESYEVEVWDSTFATLKRTITGLATPAASYTAAEQTTDFGSPQATVYLRAFQLSSIIGRGYKLEGSV